MPAKVETMFSVRERPWHGLGVVVEKQLTAAKAIKKAGLDWNVQLVPEEYTFNSKRYTVPHKFVSVREDTAKSLGTVGGHYVPLQNKDAFGFFDSLVDSGEAKYETAGVLEEGRQVWMMATLPKGIVIGGVDPIDVYLLLTNSHDGSRAVTVAVTPVRVVCQNTLNFALRGARRKYSARHVSGLQGKLQEAREALELTFDYTEYWEEQAETLLSKKMNLGRFEVFQDALVRELDMSDRLAEDFKVRTRQLFAEGETLVAVAETQWAALNTVSEYFEHLRKGAWQKPDNVLKRSWDTGNDAAKARQRALDLLVAA